VNNNLQRAVLKLLEPSATGPKGPTGKEVPFKFNPKEYAIAKSAEWKSKESKGAKKASMPEFVGPKPSQLTLELFLDGTDGSGDVSGHVDLLFSCLTSAPKARTNQRPLPPFVQFSWGKVLFTGILKSVNVKYTLFRETGIPIRATCSLTLEELPSDEEGQNPTSGALEPMRTHAVVDGDSLPSIAYREYGDPTLWRAVAEANGIDDPMRLWPGERLLIPSPTEVKAAEARPRSPAQLPDGRGS
jgi:Contractile injection system tube protein/LysM domain